jgi:hypothetical protein
MERNSGLDSTHWWKSERLVALAAVTKYAKQYVALNESFTRYKANPLTPPQQPSSSSSSSSSSDQRLPEDLLEYYLHQPLDYSDDDEWLPFRVAVESLTRWDI